jgi:putative phage-type endonuclease
MLTHKPRFQNYREAEEAILDFINNKSQNVVQRSAEWLNFRKSKIGSSEIAAAIGKNDYERIDDFIRRKCGSGFTGNIKTRWGNLFEPMNKRMAEHKFNTKIYGDTLCFQHPTLNMVVYSPDGIAAIRDTDQSGKSSYVICLFEFKSPYNRKPSNTIPTYYRPQVISGLDVIPIASRCLFIEAVFRFCQLEDMNLDDNSCILLYGQKRFGNPLTIGMMAIYTKDRSLLMGFDELEFDDLNVLSDCSEETIVKIIECIDAGQMMVQYYGPYYTNLSDKNINDLIDSCDEYARVNGYFKCGVLPWKSLQTTLATIEPHDDYLSSRKEHLEDVVKCIEACTPLSDEERTPYIKRLLRGAYEKGIIQPRVKKE